MSSLRVRTKNKLMTALGAAKPSINVAFDLAYSDFESTLERLETLDSMLRNYAASIKTFHGVASLVVGAIDCMSSGATDPASYQQKPIGVSEMQQFAGDAQVTCTDVDLMVLRETYGRLEQEMLVPVKSWLQHARSLQNEAKAFQEKKALYDHYSRKVVALRETHEKRAMMGRSGRTKEIERMFRNEQKLAATTQEYVRQSDTIIRSLRAFVLSRDAALAPLLRRVLRGRAMYAERMHEATGLMNALIEDSAEEGEDDGVLSHYMTVAQGGDRVGSAAIMAAAMSPHSTYDTVHKSSCKAFGGEEPSHASAHNRKHKSATKSSPENEKQMPLPTNEGESLYRPPRGISKLMTANMPTDAAANRYVRDEFPAPVLSKRPANELSPCSPAMAPSPSLSRITTTKSWDAFPAASAPSVDRFTNGEWSSGQQASWQQQQLPLANFQDMHMNALSGETSCFR
ncbi:unnamed protein product [Peronospora farinosa]|uniref:BAR domain-containing protein n=1 Tax=Peronospora farinosa TaxID=134698 RepID=A0AAV0U5J2_9STRA|nr:unnamed protein product [Peronospora farinosa]CAI5731877.1 unnamed protein product [Peronospora farinosa]